MKGSSWGFSQSKRGGVLGSFSREDGGKPGGGGGNQFRLVSFRFLFFCLFFPSMIFRKSLPFKCV